jgi:3'(2'), 5'-bisphosphate nucleotidase
VFETVYAAAPGFCYREFGTGERRDLGVRTAPAEGIVVAVSRSHPSARMEEFLRRYKIAGRRVSGSAIKFGFVAAGEADLYARLGPTMEWDTAAGQAIVEAAGGRMTTVDGAPFRYGKPRFENEGFIASGRSPPAT